MRIPAFPPSQMRGEAHSPACYPCLRKLKQAIIRFGGFAVAAMMLTTGNNAQSQSGSVTAKAQSQLASRYGQLPLSFEANHGQTNGQVKFLSRGSGYSLFLTDRAAVLSLSRESDVRSAHRSLAAGASATSTKARKTDTVRMELAGAARGANATGADQLPGIANYFIGSDPAKWRANVPTFAKVKYTGVYPGVDLVYYGNQGQLEYDFVVAPGADAKQIRLRFTGANKLSIDRKGALSVNTPNGRLAFHTPAIYQQSATGRRTVIGSFKLLSPRSVAFSVGPYDRSEPLVIDPTLTYSTYFGGSGSGGGFGDVAGPMSLDNAGNIYIAGATWSSDFPTTAGSYDPTDPGLTAGFQTSICFLTKLDPTGTKVLYSTYFGGNGSSTYTGNFYSAGGGDGVSSLTIDAGGNAYLTGSTWSSDFPVTPAAFQKTNNAFPYGFNAFVTKFDPTGSTLIYSTYLGGSANVVAPTNVYGDKGFGIAVDTSGNAYVGGSARSTNFPITAGAYQSVNKAGANFGSNGFLTKLNATGSGLIYSTYLGGSGNAIYYNFVPLDIVSGLQIDDSGNTYVTGYTVSSDFPVSVGAYQSVNKAAAYAKTNGFVAKMDAAGSSLLSSTLIGGTGTDGIKNGTFNAGEADVPVALALDSNKNVFITGVTASHDYPVSAGAFQTVEKGLPNLVGTCFVSELASGGEQLIYSTYLGGSDGDGCTAIALDANGQAFVTGYTLSADFPTTADAYQASNKGFSNLDSNAFLTGINATGTGLVYSTFLGGSGQASGGDFASSIAFDSVGNVHIAGTTHSADFPITANALQPTNKGFLIGDPTLFLATLSLSAATPPSDTKTTLTSDANPQVPDKTVTFTAFVTPAAGTEIPTGSVSFSIDGGPGTPVPLDDTGHAKYAISTLSVGKHTINGSYSGDSSYAASMGSLVETIVLATTSISLTPLQSTVTYGQSLSVSAFLSGSPAPTGSLTYTLDGGASQTLALTSGSATLNLRVLPAGSHALSVNYPGDSIYGPASQTLFFTVAKASLTATAASFTRAYGTANPPLTYSLTGFVNGDSSAVVSGSATLTTTATTTSNTGAYPITFASEALTAANYNFAYVPGTLTVTGGPSQCETIDYSKGFTPAGLSLNGGATVTNNLLQLTDGGFYEGRSAFYATPVPVGSFTTDFTFQIVNPLADGITFTIQSNDPTALGQAGGGLGYAGIPNSVAVKLDLFNNSGEGFSSTGFYLNGAYPATPSIDLYQAGIDLHSGHIFAVHIAHDGATTTGTITDTATLKTAGMTVPGDLTKVVGDTAYVGFTGATGLLTANQNILTWSYSAGAGCSAR